MTGIYMIKNNINEKIYIGKALNVEDRWKYGHINPLNKNKHGNNHLQNSWNKYGKNNFDFSIIEQCNEKELNGREKYWINHYKSFDPQYGYNKTFGGDGIIPTKQTRKKISDAIKGENNPFYGKNHSEEQKKKWSQMRKGVKPSDESRKKMSKSRKGKKAYWYGKNITEHMKESLSKTHKGKKISEEQKQKLRIASSNNKKYSLDEVNLIKVRLNSGETCANIAKDSQMSYSVINRIKNNKYFNEYYNLDK